MSGCLPCTELARADHVRFVVPDSELAEEVVLRHRDEKSWILHARPATIGNYSKQNFTWAFSGIREKLSERRGFDTDRMLFRDDELSSSHSSELFRAWRLGCDSLGMPELVRCSVAEVTPWVACLRPSWCGFYERKCRT